jgi:acyl-CoA thioesterase
MFELSSSEKSIERRKAEEIVNKMYEGDKFSKWLGIEIVEINEGSAVLKMEIREEMLNGFDIMHGGISYALADSALAFAANSRGKVCLSLDQTMNYPASAKKGDILTATAEEKSLTSKTGIYDVTITNQEGKKVGIFRGTVYRTSTDHITSLDENYNGREV